MQQQCDRGRRRYCCRVFILEIDSHDIRLGSPENLAFEYLCFWKFSLFFSQRSPANVCINLVFLSEDCILTGAKLVNEIYED